LSDVSATRLAAMLYGGILMLIDVWNATCCILHSASGHQVSLSSSAVQIYDHLTNHALFSTNVMEVDFYNW